MKFQPSVLIHTNVKSDSPLTVGIREITSRLQTGSNILMPLPHLPQHLPKSVSLLQLNVVTLVNIKFQLILSMYQSIPLDLPKFCSLIDLTLPLSVKNTVFFFSLVNIAERNQQCIEIQKHKNEHKANFQILLTINYSEIKYLFQYLAISMFCQINISLDCR